MLTVFCKQTCKCDIPKIIRLQTSFFNYLLYSQLLNCDFVS